MHLITIKYAHIIVSLTINFFLYTFVSCSIQSMKKISDNGDYFVVLDSGLCIYNFEQSMQINITIFNESIFVISEQPESKKDKSFAFFTSKYLKSSIFVINEHPQNI